MAFRKIFKWSVHVFVRKICAAWSWKSKKSLKGSRHWTSNDKYAMIVSTKAFDLSLIMSLFKASVHSLSKNSRFASSTVGFVMRVPKTYWQQHTLAVSRAWKNLCSHIEHVCIWSKACPTMTSQVHWGIMIKISHNFNGFSLIIVTNFWKSFEIFEWSVDRLILH